MTSGTFARAKEGTMGHTGCSFRLRNLFLLNYVYFASPPLPLPLVSPTNIVSKSILIELNNHGNNFLEPPQVYLNLCNIWSTVWV